MLYSEFQSPIMPGTCQKVCGGAVVVCKPIIVFSLAQAEQFVLALFSSCCFCVTKEAVTQSLVWRQI